MSLLSAACRSSRLARNRQGDGHGLPLWLAVAHFGADVAANGFSRMAALEWHGYRFGPAPLAPGAKNQPLFE